MIGEAWLNLEGCEIAEHLARCGKVVWQWDRRKSQGEKKGIGPV